MTAKDYYNKIRGAKDNCSIGEVLWCDLWHFIDNSGHEIREPIDTTRIEEKDFMGSALASYADWIYERSKSWTGDDYTHHSYFRKV